jgi:G3E family GTPase
MATRLIITGGFLGAGKTTLLLQAAQLLSRRGYRVGLVTNDQGEDLVDTALAAQQHIPVTEVAGGCFCCRFPDLIKALRHLQKTVAPDVILAEPVGSCTDLMATTIRPLVLYYPKQFQIGPLTILADATRNTADFPEIVSYLYHKQLAEADLIVLNKADLLDRVEQQKRKAELEAIYSGIPVMSLSARSGQGLEAWLELALKENSKAAQILELDYAHYAEAEAELGWLNAKGTLIAGQPFAATTWIDDLLNYLDADFANQASPIAHVKVSLKTPTATLKASLTGLGQPVSWDLQTETETDRAQFILNARVNTDPRTLEQTVRRALEATRPHPDTRYDLTHFECFSPLPPRPTHRLGVDGQALGGR